MRINTDDIVRELRALQYINSFKKNTEWFLIDYELFIWDLIWKDSSSLEKAYAGEPKFWAYFLTSSRSPDTIPDLMITLKYDNNQEIEIFETSKPFNIQLLWIGLKKLEEKGCLNQVGVDLFRFNNLDSFFLKSIVDEDEYYVEIPTRIGEINPEQFSKSEIITSTDQFFEKMNNKEAIKGIVMK